MLKAFILTVHIVITIITIIRKYPLSHGAQRRKLHSGLPLFTPSSKSGPELNSGCPLSGALSNSESPWLLSCCFMHRQPLLPSAQTHVPALRQGHGPRSGLEVGITQVCLQSWPWRRAWLLPSLSFRPLWGAYICCTNSYWVLMLSRDLLSVDWIKIWWIVFIIR